MRADRAAIESWLEKYLSEALQMPPGDIRKDLHFGEWGLDSMFLVGMIGDLEDWLGCRVDTTSAYEHPTITSLATHLAETQGA
jgi:8-amino-7-oxononanoate synthase